MMCILCFVLPRVFSAIRSAILAPTVSISWKWVTPRYSLLYSAANISSLVIVCSPGPILDYGCWGCWLYIWLRRAVLAGMIVRKCDGFLEIRYARAGREKTAYFLLESGVFCLRPTFIRGWRRFQNGFYDIRRLASGRGFETPPRKGLFSMILLAYPLPLDFSWFSWCWVRLVFRLRGSCFR